MTEIDTNIENAIFKNGVAQEDNDFVLTNDQEMAVARIKNWYSRKGSSPIWKRYFVLSGAAGTGKTSLIQYIIKNLNVAESSILCCAFTGKASLNLQRKGNKSSTLHSSIYECSSDLHGNPVFTLKNYIPYKLIIVDEASMISENIFNDILSFGIPTIFVGDHCQLPPIEGDFNIMKNKEMNKKREQVSVLFMLFGILFCVCLITANVLETKQMAFGPVTITGGLLVFPVSYIINDCVCEVWGFRRARLLIWAGFAMNFLFVVFGALADAIPGAPYWDNDRGFHAVFGLAPRVAAASFVAFLAGSFINAYVMSRMKLSQGGHHFSVRAVASTVLGETADSVVFFPLALSGVVPMSQMPSLIISQVVLKTLYEVVALPLTVRVVRFTKRHEGEDVYDEGISYNIFKVRNI